MNRSLHVLRRKLKTFSLTIAKCSNWFSLALAKSGLNDAVDTLRFRDGFQLKAVRPLRHTWGEIFEPAIADVYRIRSASPNLVIDVGANVGAFSCRAGFLHRSAAIHAFEPSTAQREQLIENIKLNGLTNITVHGAAVTKDGRDVVFTRLGAGGASGIILHEGGESILLKSVSLDCVDVSGVASLFVKLDCEGAEGEIIEWICEHLAALPPVITIACEYHHWCPVPLAQIIEQLKARHFAVEHRILFDESYLYASLSRKAGAGL